MTDLIGKIIWDGIDSSQMFTTLNVTYNLLNKEVTTQTVAKADGVTITNVRMKENTFKATILFSLEQLQNQSIINIHDLRRTIANFFNSDETKQFIYTKDPEVYVNAIFQGTSEITFLNNQTCTCELEFLVPDGLQHSLTLKQYDSDTNIYNISYKGTYKSFPTFYATVLEENGLIGIVNTTNEDDPKIVQIGNPEEDTTEVQDKGSKLVVNDRNLQIDYMKNNGWVFNDLSEAKNMIEKWDFRCLAQPKNVSYTENRSGMRYKKGTLTKMISSTKVGINTANVWSGFTAYRDFTKVGTTQTATNLDLKFTIFMLTGAIKQTGITAIDLIASDSSTFARVSVDKNNISLNQASLRLKIQGVEVLKQRIDASMYNKFTGNMSQSLFRKVRDQVELHSGGKIWVFNNSSYPNIQIKGIRIWVGSWKEKDTMVWHGLHDIQVTKHNVLEVVDVTNTFQANDIVKIDTAERKVYVNGLDRTDLADIGSQWQDMALKKGTNKFTIVNSDWASDLATDTYIEAEDIYI